MNVRTNRFFRFAILSAALMGAGYASAADDTLAARVEQKLQQAQLMNADVKVATHGSTVELQGWVNAPSDVDAAMKVASSVPGVKWVQSNLHTWSSDD